MRRNLAGAKSEQLNSVETVVTRVLKSVMFTQKICRTVDLFNFVSWTRVNTNEDKSVNHAWMCGIIVVNWENN